MTALQNDVFLRALLREPVPYTPIWMMRQAGRYLPEYCETRRRAGNFMGLCTNPQLATEVTLQPLERFPLDAAILFSDILTIPDAMGLGLYFTDGEGPRFERPLREEWAIRDLTAPDPNVHLRYVMDAVAEIRRALHGSVPLIGFGSGCLYRAHAIHALERAGRNWHMAYTSSSLAGIQAAVAAGLGLSILSEMSIQAEHRVLTAKDGFAPIERTEVALVAAPEARPATLRLADRLAEYCESVQAKAA